MCPVPCQGSLVISTSPGRMRSGADPVRKWRTVAGSVPMKDGMLPEFWASALPRASVSTQAKSLASFDERGERGAHDGLGRLVDDGDDAASTAPPA